MASNRLETRMTETKTLMISYACDWYSQDLRLSYVITGNLVAKNTHSRVDVATASEKNRATTLRNAATGQYVDKYYVQQRLLLDWREINSMVFPDTVYLGELLQHMISCLETIKSRLKFYINLPMELTTDESVLDFGQRAGDFCYSQSIPALESTKPAV